jgi:hypothetical protein
MNLRYASIAIVAAGLMLASPAFAFFGAFPASDDLWDVNQGGYVTGSSTIFAGSSAWNMIGAQDGTVEPGAGLFADGQAAGFSHWVRWSTPTYVTVDEFRVFALHDPADMGRSFDYFLLRAIPLGGTEYVTVYESPIGVPYAYQEEFGGLLFSHVFATPVRAYQFEAQFRQHTDVEYGQGPRVVELDAFGTIPEPGALLAISTAIIGFAGFARRRRQS